MRRSPCAYASSSSSPPGASTPSPSPQLHALHTFSSPLSMQPSHTPEHSVEPSQSPIKKKSPIKRKNKPRRGRNRPVHEIARLKQQIPVLESEIRFLWARADEMQRRRLLARAENVQLKSRVQRSVGHARLLESKLQLYVSQKQAVESSVLPSLGVIGRNLPFEAERDARILQMLSSSVDENYDKVEQVYQAAEMNETQREMEDAKVLETSDGSCVLQIRSIGVLPFEQQTVLRAMWRALEEETVLRDQECIDIGLELGRASRVIVLKREILLRGSDAGEDTPCVTCTIRVVLKKFLESGREIHVWDAFGDWPRAVSTREYGWAVIKPMDVKAADLTVVKNCIFMTSSRISDEVFGDGTQHSVARLYKQIMQDRQRVVENALLDQARSTSSSTPSVGE
ncbi:hypothetical protein PHYPSEUDO_009314 [Phytophthora pseudosyringae]|uniref:M96 mating-specific protein family n=1 Tax=Phytophthora pseudosyringae TaxID=221518 RepID=A0A8T1VC74_9STRA|nr:hypothetical protein PHYPSEUDO_009314 [Phytophthora pseudosyringae]